MQKIKFDFEATKQLIYAPNSTAPTGAPVDADGNVANDGTAIGIVLCRKNENDKYWVKQNLVVMVAGYCDIIDAQTIWGDEYSAEAMAAMSDITFCDNHELPTGGGGGGVFVTNFVVSGESATVDRTIEEVEQHYDNGDLLVFNFTGDLEMQMSGYCEGKYCYTAYATENRSVVTYGLNFAYGHFELSYLESYFDNSENDDFYIVFGI